MIKFVSLSITIISFAGICYAQEKVFFLGEVRDSLGVPLEFANVLALDTASNKMAAFGVTNQLGQFRLSLEKGKSYKIQVSFIGYLRFEKVFTPKETNTIPYSIVLKSNIRQLTDVEVISEMPVLIQGDTITYKAEAFTRGNERKLEDVLNSLPGFEVDEEGGVKIQGKGVSKLLVDGKEFFEGDTKLATKNLPANVVDKVQVLQNFNDISPLSGVNNSEQIALNIQLKEDKKNILFGDLTIGGGPEERYLAKANTFYYDNKTNINLIAGSNNIGELTFTIKDYFRFTGGLGSFAQGAGSSFRVNPSSLVIPFAERNNAQRLDNQTVALNYNFTPNEDWTLSGFAIGSKADNTLGSIQQRTYILQPTLSHERLTTEQRVESTSGLFKVGLKYTPNPSLQVDYNSFSRFSNIQNSDTQNSTFGTTSNDISGLTTQDPVQIDQQLRAFYAPNSTDIYSFEGSYQYQMQDPLYNLMNTEQPFTAIIPIKGTSPFDLTQRKEVETSKQEALFNYYRILNKTNHINFKIGNTYSRQRLTSNLFETLDDGNMHDFTNVELVNIVDYTFQDFYAGILYKVRIGDLIVSPALNLHYYNVENKQKNEVKGFDKTLLLPSLNARYQFSNSHSLTLNYHATAEFSGVEHFAEGLIVGSYNSLYGGNADLQNSLYHNLELNYFNLNLYNFFNVYGGLSYSKRFDDVSNIIRFNNLERINTPINIGTANNLLTVYASADKRFNTFRLNFQGNWNRSVSNNIIGETPNENVNFTQAYQTTLSFTLFKLAYLDIGYGISLNNYEGKNVSNKFENHRSTIDLSIEFLKNFVFKTNYEYNRYVSQSNPISNFEILDVELRYRKDKSPWEFKIEGLNLTNTTGIRRDSFNESLISTYEYFIQKRYYLLSIMYDL